MLEQRSLQNGRQRLVLVSTEGPLQRGQGTGHDLMREGVSRCLQVWPARAIRISAQAHLQRFYRHHGFETVTPEFIEDQIPHVQMLRSRS